MQAVDGRVRWVLGGGVAVGAVAVAAGAILVLGARSAPPALTYLPGDSVVVGELRADLPGDQLAKLGDLLAHFPGFADQSTLATKLDQSLDQVIGDATGGAVDYTTKLEPWLAGPAYVGLAPGAATGLPAASAGPGGSESTAAGAVLHGVGGDALVVTTTDGKVTCDAVVPPRAGSNTNETYDGVTISESSDGEMACALDGRYGLLGTVERVKAGLDAHHDGTGIDRDGTYARARDALGGDRLATLYVSGRAATAMLPMASAELGFSIPTAALPDWTIAGLRAEDDALVADVVVAPGSGSPGSGTATSGSGSPLPTLATLPPPHTSRIAGSIPGDTVLVAEVHGAGVAAQDALLALTSDPALQAQATELQSMLSATGGPAGLVGWVDDAAVVVVPGTAGAAGGLQAAGLDAGVVLVAADAATASAKESQLESLLSLAALSSGGSSQDEQVGGTTLTTIDLGDVSSLLGQAGAGTTPGGITVPAGLDVRLSIAAQGPLVVIGGSDSFVRSVIDVDAGDSLADQAAYQRAIGHAPASNLGQVYAAGDGLRAVVERLLPTSDQATWQADLQPYVQPIDSILATTTVDGGLYRSRLVVTVVTPPTGPAAS